MGERQGMKKLPNWLQGTLAAAFPLARSTDFKCFCQIHEERNGVRSLGTCLEQARIFQRESCEAIGSKWT
jgi:hypothetical protein